MERRKKLYHLFLNYMKLQINLQKIYCFLRNEDVNII